MQQSSLSWADGLRILDTNLDIMPLPFEIVCELLEECHNLAVERKSHAAPVEAWFRRHRGRVDAHDSSVVALLSTLLPDKRSDRVYCIQAPRLEKVIGRGLSLGSSRIADLARYRQPGNASDLGDCVERVLTITVRDIRVPSTCTQRPKTNKSSRCIFTRTRGSWLKR